MSTQGAWEAVSADVTGIVSLWGHDLPEATWLMAARVSESPGKGPCGVLRDTHHSSLGSGALREPPHKPALFEEDPSPRGWVFLSPQLWHFTEIASSRMSFCFRPGFVQKLKLLTVLSSFTEVSCHVGVTFAR